MLGAKLKIDGKKFFIRKFSEISVNEYILVMNTISHRNIVQYLGAFLGEDIRDKEIDFKGNLKNLEKALINISEDFTKLPRKEVITINKKNYIVNEFDNIIGKRFMFHQFLENNPDLHIVNKCLYALAVAILPKDDFDSDLVSENYNSLLDMKWTEVLPVGFFFMKKLSPQKMIIKKQLMKLTVNAYYLKKVIKRRLEYMLTNLKRLFVDSRKHRVSI